MTEIFKPPVGTVCFTDTETFSTIDIKEAGTVKYAENAELMLAGFLLDGDYAVYDFDDPSTTIPQWVHDHAKAGGWFAAHNALFDYLILKPHIPDLRVDQFIDTMGYAGAAGLPLGLEKAGYHLGISEDVQKLKDGKRLVMKFCTPRKPSKHNPHTRVMPKHAPEEWLTFRDEYLYNDVYGMVELYKLLPGITEFEQQVWADTQKINLDGIPIDMPTVELIQGKVDKLIDEESSKFIRLTSLYPTQRDRVMGWVRQNGVKILNMQAATIEKVLADPQTPPVVAEALEARANTTHISFKKYVKMVVAGRSDGTVGGTLQYYVAQTGRFGGRLLQPQNLPRGNIDGVEAVQRIRNGEFSVDLVKSAIRAMIYLPEGFTISDFKGVEARGVQWLAGDQTALDLFTSGVDPYINMAANIYDCGYEDVNDKQRFVGKQAILGLGYQMAYKKFMSMVENYGETITIAEAKKAVAVYRRMHRKVVQLWSDMEGAAMMAMNHPGDTVVLNDKISFSLDEDYRWLRMHLPSGRCIMYYKPVIIEGKYGDCLSYMSMNDKNQYVRTETYGGKLVENAVQGICRDLLVLGIRRVLDAGHRVITHIHDEAVTAGQDHMEEISALLCELPDWAEGFPLEVDSITSQRYKKA